MRTDRERRRYLTKRAGPTPITSASRPQPARTSTRRTNPARRWPTNPALRRLNMPQTTMRAMRRGRRCCKTRTRREPRNSTRHNALPPRRITTGISKTRARPSSTCSSSNGGSRVTKSCACVRKSSGASNHRGGGQVQRRRNARALRLRLTRRKRRREGAPDARLRQFELRERRLGR